VRGSAGRVDITGGICDDHGSLLAEAVWQEPRRVAERFETPALRATIAQGGAAEDPVSPDGVMGGLPRGGPLAL